MLSAAPLKSAGMRDQLGVPSHLLHAGVPRDDDVALERRVALYESRGIAGRPVLAGTSHHQDSPSHTA